VSTLGLAGLALLPGGRDGSPPVDGETGAEAVDVGRDPEWGKGPLLPRVAPSVVWTGRG
jgi:hypothetical protein